MKLLRQLMHLQEKCGYLDHAALRDLSERARVPLYRLEGLVSFYPHFRASPPPKANVHVCRDVCCEMAGCGELAQQIRAKTNGRTDVEVHDVSCIGRCEAPPAVTVNNVPVAAGRNPAKLLECIDFPENLPSNEPTDSPRAWRCDPYAAPKQRFGKLKSLASSLQNLKSTCIERLNHSGLRGMGGAGFPTGRKWDLVARELADTKYVICNADESEPGTFKDRVILEELPHLVIQGMVLAGLTVGAEQGIVYLRHEYAREQKALERAIDEARRHGVLGADAAGSGQAFDVEVFISPGGYILGEETALLEALEDKRGEPRNKPPYPGTYGLWGRPTLINNVETFALAAAIIHHGLDWWKSQGCGEFAGLKFVSVSGDVQRPGVYEIAHGMPVRELIDLAGGMKDGMQLKAFLPGGASSNFLTAGHADTALDFEAMKQAGSMLGTGAVIVFSQERNLFDMATNVVRFFRNESCGKCVPCRIGTEKAVELLDGARAGSVDAGRLDVLAELGETLEQTSICGLGQVAVNPILSMLKHFPQDVPAR